MPNRLPLARMAEMVRNRQLSPSDLVQSHLRQIEKTRTSLNAFVEWYAEDALRVARERDEGSIVGPLHGVPITVKDSFAMSGKRWAVGSRLRQDVVADFDAAAVQRLKAAGAVILGRTNTPEFLYNYETDNHVTGRTNNPWNLRCTAGGSSGGEAAAIAAYCSPGGVGSDGGGSIREPAHFCGICGLKPTPGRVSAFGHWPESIHPGGFMGVAGPMARSVRDVRMLYHILEGYDSRDPFSAPIAKRPVSLPGLRVLVMETFGKVPVQAAMRTAVQTAGRLLGDLGFPRDQFDTRPITRAPNLWLFLFGELPATLMRPMLETRLDDCHRTGIEFYQRYREQAPPGADKIASVFAERDRMRSMLLESLPKHSIILAPACGITAFPHGNRRYTTETKEIGLFEAMMPLTPWNLLGMPSLTVPVQICEDGLPAGIQLIGRPFDEELLLEVAAMLEDARGPLPGPPNA